MITKPIINLNGTSATELLDQQIAAINALRHAISTLQAAAPNARDYQIAPADAFASAMNQHRTRIIHLETVLRTGSDRRIYFESVLRHSRANERHICANSVVIV
jgi:hypothetical protein